ncbi:energy transducer TonB [uncultured Nonlabens sp.]|uniref:energy transducer TonB n=1 Tax=uncultured Nonlabens sp. TaxID=859306 RepID=UPI0030D88C16|tara:strand:- start:65252 stop:66058 length:807 start_codon:yes stop_codon:yes gene_type:complete
MKTSKEEIGAATPQNTRRADKQAANTKVNPIINFQIGLIAALVAAFLIMELTTAMPVKKFPTAHTVYMPSEDVNIGEVIIVPNKESKPEIKKTKPIIPKVDPNKPPKKVKDNTTDLPDPEKTPAASAKTPPLKTGATETGVKTAPLTPKNEVLGSVHEVPLFPGCSAAMDREERVGCLNKKMARFIQRKFDTGLANSVIGKDIVIIYVQFTIGIDGFPKDILVKAPNKELEKEAYQVISRLPEMTPGKIDHMPVNVTYALPIRFQIND